MNCWNGVRAKFHNEGKYILLLTNFIDLTIKAMTILAALFYWLFSSLLSIAIIKLLLHLCGFLKPVFASLLFFFKTRIAIVNQKKNSYICWYSNILMSDRATLKKMKAKPATKKVISIISWPRFKKVILILTQSLCFKSV